MKGTRHLSLVTFKGIIRFIIQLYGKNRRKGYALSWLVNFFIRSAIEMSITKESLILSYEFTIQPT